MGTERNGLYPMPLNKYFLTLQQAEGDYSFYFIFPRPHSLQHRVCAHKSLQKLDINNKLGPQQHMCLQRDLRPARLHVSTKKFMSLDEGPEFSQALVHTTTSANTTIVCSVFIVLWFRLYVLHLYSSGIFRLLLVYLPPCLCTGEWNGNQRRPSDERRVENESSLHV